MPPCASAIWRLSTRPIPDPSRLRREEGHEQVRRVRQARSFVVDPELEAAALAFPADRDAAAGLQRGVRRVVYQIDQQLLELIGIGADVDVRAAGDVDRQPRFDVGDPADQLRHVDGVEARRRQLGQARVGGREAAERIGSRGDHRQAALHVLVQSPDPTPRLRASIDSRLPAIDLIGASELLISWPMTRISRCHACRSSSRSGRLTSASTSN